MPTLNITVDRPEDGVTIGASMDLSDEDARGLINILTDLTGATTGISGINPDRPQTLTREQLLEAGVDVIDGEPEATA